MKFKLRDTFRDCVRQLSRDRRFQNKWISDRFLVDFVKNNYDIDVDKRLVNWHLPGTNIEPLILHHIKKHKIKDKTTNKHQTVYYYFICEENSTPPIYSTNRHWEELYNSFNGGIRIPRSNIPSIVSPVSTGKCDLVSCVYCHVQEGWFHFGSIPGETVRLFG